MFMHFMLGAYVLTVINTLDKLIPLLLGNDLFVSVTIFDLKSILSVKCSLAKPVPFWFPFLWNFFFLSSLSANVHS